MTDKVAVGTGVNSASWFVLMSTLGACLTAVGFADSDYVYANGFGFVMEAVIEVTD